MSLRLKTSDLSSFSKKESFYLLGNYSVGEEGKEDEVDLGTGTNKSSRNVRELGLNYKFTAPFLRDRE